MLIEEYLQMRIQSAESILAGEELSGNVPKAMAEKAAIAELRGVEAFLNNASKSFMEKKRAFNVVEQEVIESGDKYMIVAWKSMMEGMYTPTNIKILYGQNLLS